MAKKYKMVVIKYKNTRSSCERFGFNPNKPQIETLEGEPREKTKDIIDKWVKACDGNPHFPRIDESTIEVIFEECYEGLSGN